MSGVTKRVLANSERIIMPLCPWVFWQDAGAGRKTALLWQVVPHCLDKECDCREVDVLVTAGGDDLDAYSEEGGRLHLWFKDGREEAPATFLGKLGGWLSGNKAGKRPWARVRIEFYEGSSVISPNAAADERDEAVAATVPACIDGEVLEALYDEFRVAQGYAFRTEPLSPRGDWQTGAMVAWNEAYSDARADRYRMGGKLYEVVDHHCVEPGCECGTSSLTAFRRGEGDAPNSVIGRIRVQLDSGKMTRMTVERGESQPMVKQVFERFAKRHKVAPYLSAHRDDLTKKLGPLLYPSESPEAKARGAIGRNEPCPCGSGKKFKRCCGADARS